jgi:formate dehydrogenase iron-sulfur subunit
MHGKAFFIDTTKCTACRGCQIACKSWNRLPASKTLQQGSHQNPVDLSPRTWKLIRFSEIIDPTGRLAWLFFPDQCRHCVDPPCSYVPDTPGAIMVDEKTGAVIHASKLSAYPLEDVKDSCPYNIPRSNQGSNIFAKCTMCLDRIRHNLPPACVKACATGTMNFGDYDRMAEKALRSLTERKLKNPKACLTDMHNVRVFYLLDSDPSDYWQYA